MTPTTHQLNPAPLSFEKLESQKAQHFIHVERITGPDGETTEAPRLNRKGRRKAEALDRRKFQPATRPLNRHERQQMLLNKYEDSLEAKKPVSGKRKKKRHTTAAAAPVETSRQMNLARRAVERALQAVGLS